MGESALLSFIYISRDGARGSVSRQAECVCVCLYLSVYVCLAHAYVYLIRMSFMVHMAILSPVVAVLVFRLNEPRMIAAQQKPSGNIT